MAGRKVTVVLSQSPGKVPAKRHMEEEIAAALLMEPDVDVSIIPHLYDLPADDSGLLFLRGVSTELVVLAWLYPRATRWVLDRQNVRGRIGVSQFDLDEQSEDDEDQTPPTPTLDLSGVPNRSVFCLDLRKHAVASKYVDEVKRIVREAKTPVVTLGIGSPSPPSPAPSAPRSPLLNVLTGQSVAPTMPASSNGSYVFDGRSSETPGKRRWYPVIDYTRCTNCMECIDFCLFGVYGVDAGERILVEQQDNCKKGCPACSRVCPENAIIFPEYKTPAIAGAPVDAESGNSLETAVAERDRELMADGRTAVGMAVGIPKRQSDKAGKPKDELDDLMDGLDSLGL
jgi:NAD-dependent dihydropyrimidine dehydrogenase PreA subunit